MNGARIIGVGTAVPEGTMLQENAAAYAATRALDADVERGFVERIYRNTSVRSRASVLFDATDAASKSIAFFECEADPRGPTTAERMRRFEREAPSLAARACVRALAASGVSAEEITHLVTVSCTGMSAPGVDCALVAMLGMRDDVARTNIGFMGCYGGIVGLRTGAAVCMSDASATVLVVCVELCSLHYQPRGRADQMVANALFADGAGAAVVRAGAARGAAIRTSGSLLMRGTSASMSWRIGDHGCVMTLAQEVPRLIRERLKPWCDRTLEGAGLTTGQVAGWAVHPGGPRVMDAVAEGLALREGALEASRAVLARSGNMSSGTVLFVLEELRARGLADDAPCVLLAFGPGLCAEAVVVGEERPK